MPCAKSLAAIYRNECGVHYLESLLFENEVPAANLVLEDYVDEHCIGPLVRFSHCHSRGPSSLEWNGSILIAVEHECQHVSMTFQSCIRATPSAIKVKGSDALPERPVKISGSRFLHCYGYHFWRFDINVSLHPNQETECKYSVLIVRRNITSRISGYFMLGSTKSCDWRVKTMSLGNFAIERRTASKMQNSEKCHVAILPDWSPFFLENKNRAGIYRRSFASTPYVCERHLLSPLSPESNARLLSNGHNTTLWQTVFSLHRCPQDFGDHECCSTFKTHSLDGTQRYSLVFKFFSLFSVSTKLGR